MKSFNISRRYSINDGSIREFRGQIQHKNQLASNRVMTSKNRIQKVMTVPAWLLMTYTALFYYPLISTSPKPEVIQNQGSIETNKALVNNSKNPLESYIEMLLFNRGYMKQGHTVTANYKLDHGMMVDLTLVQCKGPVILEIIKCNSEIMELTKIGDRPSGQVTFIIPQSGFYHFKHKRSHNNAEKLKYKVKWTRS